MKRILVAVTLLATLSSISFAQQVQQVTIGDNFNYGLTYSLPTTVMQLTAKARCTKTVAGPYAMYAEKFLGITDAPQSNRTEYEITHLRMEAIPQANSQTTYHISFSEKGALPTFYLTDDRCLLAINQAPVLPKPEVEDLVDPGQQLRYKPTDVLTPEILKAGSKSRQAQLIAQEIFSIRESRSELVRGESDNLPHDGKQLQLMLDNLAAQEEALLSYFVGTTTVTEQKRVFSFAPTDVVTDHVVIRFSRDLGFVEADDLAGSPLYVSLSLLEDNRMPEMDEKARKRLEKGIAFCIPGKAHIRVYDSQTTLAQGDMYLSQFGHVEQLPQAQFTDKKKPCSAVFDPATGSIKVFDSAAQ